MADAFSPKFVDLVRNSTTTTGTGDFALGPAPTGFTSFAAAVQPGDSFYYSVMGVDKPAESEVGRGTLQANGTIAREPISGPKTDFTIGTKLISLIAAAEWFTQINAARGGSGGSADETTVATRTALAAASTARRAAVLTESGREGLFVFDSSNLSAAVAADPRQGVHVAPSSDPSGATGAWVRRSPTLTPHMFGAAGNGTSDDTSALQAFFDFAQDPVHARRHLFDWRGEWAISNTIYATFFDGGLFGNAPERRFVMGTLRVLPVAAPLDVVLEIAGPRQHWEGLCSIHHSGAVQYGTPYASRRYTTGVRMRMVSGSTFGDFIIDDTRRDLVFADSRERLGFTVRAGTAYEATFPNANNIGVRIGAIYGRTFGAQHVSSYGSPSTAVSAKTHGGVSGTQYAAETFDPSPAGFATSFFQRTRLSVASTANIETLDLVKTRLELTPAIYGTIAYDNAASRIVWSSGDPATHLQVGDVYPVARNGPNAGTEFRIVSFGGTSNRQITVTPAPLTDAATADAGRAQYGKWDFHTVSKVESATSLLVYPWVPSRNNSAAYIVHGAAFRVAGGDAANTQVRQIGALIGGMIYWGDSLYAPTIDSVLGDYAEVGLRLGTPGESSNHLGLTIDHGHLEAVTASILSHTGNVYGTINIQSVFYLEDCIAEQPRSGTNAQAPVAGGGLGRLTIEHGGTSFHSPLQAANEGASWSAYAITNHPESREVFVHDDSATIGVDFDGTVARLFPKHHWARIIWTDSDGSAPDGTLTLNLSARLTALGWTFAGDMAGSAGTITVPGANVVLELQYLTATKKVVATRVGGAGGSGYSGGDLAVTGNLSTTGNAVLGDSATDDHTINGSVTITSSEIDDALIVSGSGVAFTLNSTDNSYAMKMQFGGVTRSYVGSDGTNLLRVANASAQERFAVTNAGVSVAGAMTVSGTIGAANLSGANTGDQVITLTGDVTGSGGSSFAATIAAGAVTFGKMVAATGAGFVAASAAGSFGEVPAATARSILGLAAIATTGSGADLTAASVTYAKLQNVSASARLLGRASAGAGAVEELGLAGGLSISGTNLTLGAITPSSVASAGAVSSSGAGGIGYASGAGGAVTQATSKSTGVTLNKAAGRVTMSAASLAANTVVAFTVTNSEVAATDTINVNLQSGNAAAGAYRYWVDKVSAGSFVVAIENRTAGALSEALVLNFAVLKAVIA